MRTLIAATDFSPVSLNAVNYAADMANMIGARLVLFHAFLVPVAVSEIPIPGNSSEELEAEAQRNLQELKDELLDRTGERIIIYTKAKQGNVLVELREYCKSIDPFALVIGAETMGGFERFLFAGITVEAVKHFHCPVLVVPPLVTFTKFRKIGLACDFQEVLETVRVDAITQLVEEFHAELHVIHVHPGPRGAYSPETTEESGKLQELLGQMHPKYHIVPGSDIEGTLMKQARTLKLDLLIVIPKKHGIIDKIFEQSHSKQLVLNAMMPVLSLHEA